MVKAFTSGIQNWRTTLFGVATGLAIVFAGVAAALDGDPETIFDAGKVFEALAGVGMILWGIFSRDSADD